MPGDEPAPDAPPADASPSWRQQAVARSLDHARVKAEKRVQSFLDAALELLNGPSGKDFTVQDVVRRSGQSLRSFYLYFNGKYELLLTLFEESVHSAAEQLQDVVAREDDPLERLHAFMVEYYRLCQPRSAGKSAKPSAPRVMADFAQQLLTEHPTEASRAFVPLVSLLERLLDEAAAAGALRPKLDHRRVAGVLLQATMFHAFAATISGTSVRRSTRDAAEELWGLLFSGVRAPH